MLRFRSKGWHDTSWRVLTIKKENRLRLHLNSPQAGFERTVLRSTSSETKAGRFLLHSLGVDNRKRSPVLSPQLTPSRFSKDPNSPTLNAVRLARFRTERTRRALKDSARYYSSQRAAVDWSPGRSPQRLCRLCDLFVALSHASCNPPVSPLVIACDLIRFQRNSRALRTPERTFGAREKEGVAGSAETKVSKNMMTWASSCTVAPD